MTDMAWLHSGFAPRFGGLLIGGWTREEPDRVPQSSAEPWMLGAGPMLAAYDSIAFELGGRAARDGFASGLARAQSIPVPRTEPRIRSVVHLGGGVFAYDANAIAVERGDSTGFMRGEIVTVNHGSTGTLDRSGFHSYEVAAAWTIRGTRVGGGFSHRGVAQSVAGGEEQAGRAESGYATVERRFGSTRVVATFERGYDGRESFGGQDAYQLFSRRDADATTGSVVATLPLGNMWIEASARGGRIEVLRSGDQAFSSEARWGWGSLAATLPIGPGIAEITAGAGQHQPFDNIEPSLSAFYRFGFGRYRARVGAERLVRAVWTDLNGGEAPFLQSTWAGVASLERVGDATRLRAYTTAGRCRDRAQVGNQPFEELWLRDGFVRDGDPYEFNVTGVDGEWRIGRWSLSGEGFVFTTNGASEQARFDPETGGRAEVTYRTTFFRGDLGLQARAGVDYVGRRESDLFDERTLPGFATSQVGLSVTLVDATIALMARNLEDQHHELPWLDTFSFAEALSPGREWRLFLTLRLSN
jgi:hypothetical protein